MAAWKEKKLWIGVLALAAALTAVVWCRFNHTFTTQRWLESPEQRSCLVDDLLGRYQIEDMEVHQVKALLGDTDLTPAPAGGTLMTYPLGTESGLLGIDEAFLVLHLCGDTVDQVDVVTS